MVAMARAFLDNPRWVWHAAERFGVKIDYPPQYARSRADRGRAPRSHGPPEWLAHAERRLVRPAERDAGDHRRHGRRCTLPLRLLLRVSTNSHRPLDHAPGSTRRPARRPAACRASAARPITRAGFSGRHGDHLLEREAQVEELAHHPGQVRHARRVAREDVDVGRDRVGRRSPAAIAASAIV